MPEPFSLAYLIGPHDAHTGDDVLALARHYARRNHRVTMIGPLSRSYQAQLEEAGARWVNFALPDRSHQREWRLAIARLRRLLASLAVDVLHCRGLKPAFAALLAQARQPQAPTLIASFSDLTSQRHTLRRRLALSFILRRAGIVTVASPGDRAVLTQIDARRGPLARFIPRGVDLQALSSSFDAGIKRRALGLRPEAAIVGLLSPSVADFGFDTLFAAIARLLGNFPSVEFLIVGDGPDHRALQLQAHQLGLTGSVVFRGERVDTAEIIASLNVLVVLRELPDSVRHMLQALSHDVPVVACDYPLLREVLGGLDPASLVPPDDAAALTQAIAAKLEHLPPPGEDGELLDDGRVISGQEMLATADYLDVDRFDNALLHREELSQAQRTLNALASRFDVLSMIRATDAVYREALELDLAPAPNEEDDS